jgi:sugar phosphate isomerase/epimerase
MARRPELIAAYFTLAGNVMPLAGNMASPHSLAARVNAAARAGYAGIGLHTDDLLQAIERHGHRGIKQIIADGGLKYLELEALLDWFADGERRRTSDAARRILLDAAERLGAYQIKVVGDLLGGEWPLSRLAAEFGMLCRQAASAGAQVTIEILPFSNIRDLQSAGQIVAGAGAANGGILIDIWHLARGGIAYEDLATIPVQYIKHVELDDADTAIVGSLLEDTTRHRLLPGEGSFDVPRFLRCVQSIGYEGLYGVEIVSDAQRALPLEQAAELSFRAASRQFEYP